MKAKWMQNKCLLVDFLLIVLKYHSFVKRKLNTVIMVVYQGTGSSLFLCCPP